MRLIVTGVVSALLAITPLLPAAVALAVVALVRSKDLPPSSERTWGRALCGAAIVIAVVMTPLYLMFLDAAGVFRS